MQNLTVLMNVVVIKIKLSKSYVAPKSAILLKNNMFLSGNFSTDDNFGIS